MRILVIEAELQLQNSVAKALREASYAVDTAKDGENALYKAETRDYDAVVLDVMLPIMDGWQVLERLRKSKRTPVLMLTARDSTRERVRGLDLGADDYLVKPFGLPELLARLHALIRRTAGVATTTICLPGVVLDLRLRTVTVKGARVSMTAREYGILEYLALHRGEVVSRTELYKHLMDETDETLSNLMDVHISAIRKKLPLGLITTCRGRGYYIE